MKNQWNVETHNQKKIKNTQIYISLGLAVLGLIVIASQVIPLTKSYVEGKIQETKKAAIAEPVPESYKTFIKEEFAYYDPGQSYFANLTQNLDGNTQFLVFNENGDILLKRIQKSIKEDFKKVFFFEFYYSFLFKTNLNSLISMNFPKL
jgi:hypothetical protein